MATGYESTLCPSSNKPKVQRDEVKRKIDELQACNSYHQLSNVKRANHGKGSMSLKNDDVGEVEKKE